MSQAYRSPSACSLTIFTFLSFYTLSGITVILRMEINEKDGEGERERKEIEGKRGEVKKER